MASCTGCTGTCALQLPWALGFWQLLDIAHLAPKYPELLHQFGKQLPGDLLGLADRHDRRASTVLGLLGWRRLLKLDCG